MSKNKTRVQTKIERMMGIKFNKNLIGRALPLALLSSVQIISFVGYATSTSQFLISKAS